MFRVWVNRLTTELANPVVAVVDVRVSVELHAVFALARPTTTIRLSVNVRVLLAVLAEVLPPRFAVLLVPLTFVLQRRFAVLLIPFAGILQRRFAVLLVVLADVLRVLL